MAKSKPNQSRQAVGPVTNSIWAAVLPPRGIKRLTFVVGIVLLVMGFCLLRLTDPAGRNWASLLSPFLLLLGYGAIGFSLYTPSATQK
jgi:hypothetical protein